MGNDIASDEPRMAALADLLHALAKLGALPRRTGAFVEIEEAVFALALKDDRGQRTLVAAMDLETAVHRIVQGCLGHGFHPSPPELRRVCDEVRDERRAEVQRRTREQRLISGAESRRLSRITHSDEERARVRMKAEQTLRALDAASVNPRMRPKK